MDHWRYPIGQFVPIEDSTPEQRNSWIEEIMQQPSTVRLTLQNLTKEQLCTPYRPGGWTVQQVVHHMADNDMNAFIRFKRALTEDSPVVSSYREDSWAELSDYQAPIEASMLLMESIHIRFAALLRSLHEADYRKTFTSPTHGAMSLDHAVQRYVWHSRHHLAQIISLKKRMDW